MLSFRELLALREARGDLVRIRRPVHPRYEMPALMQQIDGQRRAFLFEQVRGGRYPVVGGLLNRLDCLRAALSAAPGAGAPADGPGAALRLEADLEARLEAGRSQPIAPVEVGDGPVKQQVLDPADVDLMQLGAPTTFEYDSGAFVTGAVGVTRNPWTGALNVGIYRALIVDRTTMLVNANPSSDLHLFYEQAARSAQSMPIALAVGVAPALMIAAVCKLPTEQSELGLAGALMGRPLELVRCESSDLLVPAEAEIVIEGRVDCSRQRENTLGEFVGHYGTDVSPLSEVTAITQRRDAMHYAILAGRNPEHNTVGGIAGLSFERAVERALRGAVPELRDVHVHLESGLGAMAHAAISIDKRDDAEPMRVIQRALRTELTIAGITMPVQAMTKRIVVVDGDVDVHDLADVEWAIWTRAADARKFRVIGDVESWNLERCAKPGRGSLRVAIDATCDIADREKLRRTRIPGAEQIRLADYLS